ncbi:MAG: DsbA family protein [Chloroflexi bacterium]|nr:DsbA family protein [Chloroflexota bacterium]
MAKVKQVYGDRLRVNWKNFALEEINKKQSPEWHVWDQPDDYPSRSLPAFRAAEAARRQGPQAYDRMHFELLEGRHERRRDFRDASHIEEMAQRAGLDLPRFRRDVADRSLLQRVASDHIEAVTKYGVFGTPTFHFPGAQPFFMRIKPLDDAQANARTFESLYSVFVAQDNIDEVKRPHLPQG